MLSLLVHLLALAGSGPADRAEQLQQQINAAIASRAPATIELSGTYNFNRSSLLIIGSTSQLTLRPSPSCVAPSCVPELRFSIWLCGEEPTDGSDCSLINFGDPARPECTNLLNMYQAATGASRAAVEAEVEHMEWSAFKPRLADALVAQLAPIQARYADVLGDRAGLQAVLDGGAARADEAAQETLQRAKHAMGFVPSPPRA